MKPVAESSYTVDLRDLYGRLHDADMEYTMSLHKDVKDYEKPLFTLNAGETACLAHMISDWLSSRNLDLPVQKEDSND